MLYEEPGVLCCPKKSSHLDQITGCIAILEILENPGFFWSAGKPWKPWNLKKSVDSLEKFWNLHANLS